MHGYSCAWPRFSFQNGRHNATSGIRIQVQPLQNLLQQRARNPDWRGGLSLSDLYLAVRAFPPLRSTITVTPFRLAAAWISLMVSLREIMVSLLIVGDVGQGDYTFD